MHPEVEEQTERKKVQDKESEPKKEKPELEKYWQIVKENPSDFTGWTYLLQYVEQEGDLSSAKEAFMAFFKYYPYCYGYWKKYADLEKKLNGVEEAEKVFEDGVVAVPLSVDLWIHYLNFYKTQYKDSYSKVKQLFERAVEASGREFRSDRLWDLYLNWEQENKNLKEVTIIYDKLLSIPTQLYSHHFEKFQEHVKSNPPKEILSTDEFINLHQEYVNSKKKAESFEEEDEASESVSADAPPPGVDSEEAPPGEESSSKVEKDIMDEDEAQFLKENIIKLRKTAHEANEVEVSKRWAYEEGIKRPYFHVKPLERAQLKNWREYLDFEIENGAHEGIVILFERCMIACALYEDMWLKYSKYMEAYGTEAVRGVYRRACQIHLPKKTSINFSWAAYEEKQGNYEEASQILETLEKNVPDMLETTLHRINLERRQGNHEKVETLYENWISECKSKRTTSHMAAKYARYLYKVRDDFTKAAQVLTDALEKDPLNSHLYMQLVDVGFQSKPINVDEVLQIFDKALASDMEPEQKISFSQRKLEFLEDFDSDPNRIHEAFEDYTKLLRIHYATTRKRPGEELDDKSREDKKAKSELNGSFSSGVNMNSSLVTTPTQPAVASTAPTQDVSTYSYQQPWVGYPQTAYNYQQTWSTYPTSYYSGH